MAGTQRPDPLIAGRYRLGKRLGRGGMAEVYDAFDERLERRVALKALRPEVAADAQMRQRFEAEARAAARLSHPAVVSVYDSGEHAGRTFLIMERLPGETLADRIKAGPVDQRWLKVAATDVLSALAAAHAIGLIHRDIKPGNVLITDDDRVKVADFGIAKMMVGSDQEDLTQVGMVLGTPAYLAPERLAGEPATVGTDLYALAVVLYEAATGHKPAAGAADATVAGTRAGAGPGAAMADPPLDPALARVIRRAMAPNPADRYPSADAMAADLARGAQGPPVAATVALPQTALAPAATQVLAGPPPPEPTQVAYRREVTPEEIRGSDPERRRGLAVAAAIIALLIVVVVLVLILTHHSGSSSPTTTTTPGTVTTPAASSSTTAPKSTTSESTTTTTEAPTTTAPTTTTTVPKTTTTTKPATTTTSSSSTTSTTTSGSSGTTASAQFGSPTTVASHAATP